MKFRHPRIWQEPLLDKVRRKSEIDPVSGCWMWQAACNDQGYAQVKHDGRVQYVHRLMYELMVGPIPEGLFIDHVAARGCVHRNCVNPEHLEPVTCAENNQRAVSGFCIRGHDLRNGDVYIRRDTGHPMCRECRRIRRANGSK